LEALKQVVEFPKLESFNFGMPAAAKFDPAIRFDFDASRFQRHVDTAEQKRLEKVKNKRPIGFVANPRRVDR